MTTKALPANSAFSAPSDEAPRTPLINARSVAWALSTVSIVSLVIGMAAVEFFGSFTRSPLREQNPEKLTSRPVTPDAQRPTVLLPMNNPPLSAGGENLGGFDSLFAAPARDSLETSRAPRPSGSAATLPPTRQFE
jgi:hypothetical protein